MALFDRPSAANSQLLPAVRLQLIGLDGQQYYENANERTGLGSRVGVENPTRTISIDTPTERKSTTAYSLRLAPLVIADYDRDGNVRGIEFLGGVAGKIEDYVKLAVQKSQGRVSSGFVGSGVVAGFDWAKMGGEFNPFSRSGGSFNPF